MKTAFIRLDRLSHIPDTVTEWAAHYSVPTLPAYAFEYAELQVDPDLDGVAPTRLSLGNGFSIDGSDVVWHHYRPPLPGNRTPPLLTLYYHGIRDYRMLFPAVGSESLRSRLANYYEEADKAFEVGAWLSFALMCGVVFEGLLAVRHGALGTGFSELIEKGYMAGWLDQDDRDVIERIRRLRNLAHPRRHPDPYVSRADAMDARATMDRIVRRFSYPLDDASEMQAQPAPSAG